MCHNTTVMGKTKAPLLLSQERILETVGTNIKLARLRRDLSTEQVAERAGIGRSTLVKVEKGDGGVALATYLKVLFVLGLEGDIKRIAADDAMGYRLQDAKLITKERASRK